MGKDSSIERAVLILFLLGMCWFWALCYFDGGEEASQDSRTYRTIRP